ncbi:MULTISPECIES: DUF5133 domain-containing protein [unclassified Streptomyces]|uniref:DUF5133 domain-containing protein n=1 Tax=unclassified Streptomyces TaxID=2593676 RepID=UPI0019066DCA|nr:DUF5133 domain-containing protein [Streptomyces sp. HSG2]
MLVPDPKIVRELLTRYASLRIAQAERESAALARELADVGYTLCVTTGETTVRDALGAADAILMAAGRPGAAGASDREGEAGLSMAV